MHATGACLVHILVSVCGSFGSALYLSKCESMPEDVVALLLFNITLSLSDNGGTPTKNRHDKKGV